MLSHANMALLYARCKDHQVARCDSCGTCYRLWDLGLDLLSPRRDLVCPTCRRVLSEQVAAHVIACLRDGAPGEEPAPAASLFIAD